MEEVPQPIRLARYRIDVALIDAASCGLLLAAAAAASPSLPLAPRRRMGASRL